ncbi:TRAP transporter large permease subunit [Sulfitobacter porphyrae]|uniref:TRAP transporter large permease subunit n=1 Tax=Sulfitobacter porphyrae TaxID=1246864 RepID=A0ABW2BB74_9RHOB
MAAIAGCAGFGAVCGSSLATASTMGRVALPELEKYRYSGALATGTLAAGGVLGILIPPSVVLIIYAIIVEANIVTMFAAALLPGLLAVVLFILTIAIYVWIKPEGPAHGGVGGAEFRAATVGMIPVLGIFGVVLGVSMPGCTTRHPPPPSGWRLSGSMARSPAKSACPT